MGIDEASLNFNSDSEIFIFETKWLTCLSYLCHRIERIIQKFMRSSNGFFSNASGHANISAKFNAKYLDFSYHVRQKRLNK